MITGHTMHALTPALGACYIGIRCTLVRHGWITAWLPHITRLSDVSLERALDVNPDCLLDIAVRKLSPKEVAHGAR